MTENRCNNITIELLDPRPQALVFQALSNVEAVESITAEAGSITFIVTEEGLLEALRAVAGALEV